MKPLRFLIAAALMCASSTFALPARADKPEATIGITLNPAIAVHESFNDTVHVPPIPVPILEGSYRSGPVELAAFGLPPTIAVPYSDAIQGQTALRMTILDATLRFWAPGNRLAIGIGETLYNQTTHYAVADFYGFTDERQYSRVVGGHYEVLARVPFRAGFVETSVRYAPAMLGTQVSTYGGQAQLTRYDPERGQQVDANIRYIHRIGKSLEAILGVRYVNFTAAYDLPNRPLSDRNAGLLPSFGYRWTIGP